jgi:hypothetical protein
MQIWVDYIGTHVLIRKVRSPDLERQRHRDKDDVVLP